MTDQRILNMAESSSSFSEENIIQKTTVPPILVWEGEWSGLKSRITRAREFWFTTVDYAMKAADFPSYVSLFRGYSKGTGQYVSSLIVGGQDQFHRYEWVGRTFCIVSASTYIMAKSSSLGTYKMTRNGLLCSSFLVSLLFPTEVGEYLRKTVWFSPRGLE